MQAARSHARRDVGDAKDPAPVRRTQQERRDATIRKLIDAATEALVEVGYAATSVQVVCVRAGVSQGALFRHFESREALMVAVGEDLGRRTLARFRQDFEARRGKEEPLALALGLVRARCRSRSNQAWYELAMAARTSPGLRRALRPVAAAYHDAIVHLGRELLPELSATLGADFPAIVETVVAVFDGESVHRFLLPPSPDDARRVELLRTLAELVPSARRGRAATADEKT